MEQINGKIALVTGGSRGFGRGIVRALAAEGATTWALARDSEQLDQLKAEVAGVQTMVADVTNPQTAPQALRAVRPDLLVLNAGAMPSNKPVHQQSWDEFARNWNTDVYMTFAFGKESLLLPLAAGSVVVIISSGAALAGSPLSGGYAGSKRTQMFLAGYLQGEADASAWQSALSRWCRARSAAPPTLGQAAAAAYAARQGISEQEFLARFGPPLTPEIVGCAVVSRD